MKCSKCQFENPDQLIEKSQKQKEFFGGPTNVYSILHSLCGLSLGWTGNFKKALTFCEKGNLAAAAINDARTLGMCDYLLGMVLKGELEPAKEHLASAIKYNEKLKHTPSLPHSYNWLRPCLCPGGRFGNRL